MTIPPFEKDLAQAKTLDAAFYRDPQIFALEKERIFARTWQPVARAEQVMNAGDYVSVEVGGEPIVVVRGQDGVLRAFFNVCRHRAGAVAEGCGNRKTLQCRYHGWTYDLEGRLCGTPEMEGAAGFDKKDYPLAALRVETWGAFVFVNLDKDARPFAETFPEMVQETKNRRLEDMRLVLRKDYVIACNWKVYVDNYLEGYHVPVAHPRLYKELDYARYTTHLRKEHSLQHAPMRNDASMYEGDDDAAYYWAFPNWMLNIYPDNASINIIVPLGIDRTLTIFEWYFHDADRPEVKERAERTLQFSDEIQQEDIVLCEAVQKRIFSRAYRQGRFNPARESGVHHFQRLVHEFLSL